MPAVSYSLPKHAHTDTDVVVQTETADLDGLTIEWLVDNTYGFQDWPTYVDGRLSNDGGTIHFKRAGIYELVARITDETGRVFLYESKDRCEVLPVLTIGFELPADVYKRQAAGPGDAGVSSEYSRISGVLRGTQTARTNRPCHGASILRRNRP